MFYLIGLGLSDDVSQRAIEIAKRCDCYCELYTNRWLGSFDGLQKTVGKEIKILKRSDLEENLDRLLLSIKNRDVVLFVPGDPLAATTHIDIVIEAKKREIPIKIIHNASIFSAVGETGLQLYKFGRTATVPFNKQLGAVRDAVKANKKTGLHTLLLLDLDAEFGLYMGITDALKILLEAKIVKEKEMLVGAGALGTDASEIKYAAAKELLTLQIPTPSALVIPGKLHFKEKEFLEMLKYDKK